MVSGGLVENGDTVVLALAVLIWELTDLWQESWWGNLISYDQKNPIRHFICGR